MTESAHLFDVTEDTFANLVLKNSFRVPVLADFWADWCQPCQMLMPLLKRLAEGYQGAFLLAKINADDQQALAARFAVRGLPTVKVFRNGEMVDELIGVQPESAYREVIERYRAKPSERLRERAEAAWQGGKREQALGLLREALALEPDNTDVKIALAEKLFAGGELEAAAEIFDALPAESRMRDAASALQSRLEFAAIARDSPEAAELELRLRANPQDHTARRQLGARRALEGKYEAALEQFLEILRRAPSFGDEAGRKGLLAVFNILGSDAPLAATYRRRMFALLH